MVQRSSGFETSPESRHDMPTMAIGSGDAMMEDMSDAASKELRFSGLRCRGLQNQPVKSERCTLDARPLSMAAKLLCSDTEGHQSEPTL
jgi:hypothetical protein